MLKARLAGDSGLRPGVSDGGIREDEPVGEFSSDMVGVGGGGEDSAELRLLARARGTNIPDIDWAVVKYRTL